MGGIDYNAIPDSVLAAYPLAAPPNGTLSNFVDPPTSGYKFVIVGAVLVPIMLAFVTIRVYSKVRIMGTRSSDDLTCLIGALGTVIYYIVVTIAVVRGKYGRHAWDTSVLISIQPSFAVPVYILNWLATVILPFAKITFFIFYLQLFRPFKWLRYCCYAGIVVTVASFLSFFVAQMALATPHPGESWLEMDLDPRELESLHYLSIPITAISFGLDVYTFVLPIAGVSRLNLTPRRKFGVIFVFLTGFIACLASLLSLIYKVRLNDTTDVIWQSMAVNITIMTEMAVGVSASCMPSLAKFLGHQFPNFSIVDSLLSFKAFSMLGSRKSRGDTSLKDSGSFPRSYRFNKVAIPSGGSDENLKAAYIETHTHDLKSGNETTGNRARVYSGGAMEMEERVQGIRMDRAWETRLEE